MRALRLVFRQPAVLVWLCLLAVLWAASPAWAADVAGGYQAAVKEFKQLCADPASNGRRDLWRALDLKLAALAKAAGRDPLGAKILYYQAWTNAELAARSYLKSDFEAAADLYGRVVTTYRRHAWADDAQLRRATILVENLKRPDEAKVVLTRLLRQHPKGDMASRAKALLAEIDTGSGGQADKAPDTADKRGKQDKPDKGRAASDAKAPPAATSAKPAVLRHLDLNQNAASGRLTLTLDRETTYRYQILDQKRSGGEAVKRLYIDLDNTRTGPGIPVEKHYRKGAVSRLRAGYFTPETVRVVLELDAVRQYEIHSENGPFRVVLDLTTDAKSGGKTEYRAEAAPKKNRAKEETPPPPAGRGNTKPTAAAKKRAGSLVEQFGLSVRTIMIDPGHGGKDPGAQAHGLTEKNINLAFAKELGAALRARGFDVLYTRTTDVFIPLEKRTEMANSKKADLFVSVHCNAHGDASSSGLETYSLNLATTQDAIRVAARENAASQRKISDLQAILTDLMLSAKTAESKDLAGLVQKRSLRKLRGYGTRDRGPHEAPFFVLIGADMPAVLVELGYITNPAEAKRLTSPAYLRALARGMADGIVAYKQRIERYANL